VKFDTLLEKYKAKAKGVSIEDIARKHGITISKIKKQLEIGKKVEREHGGSSKKAKTIAMDHLVEDPKYYVKLKKAKL
jgi:hypothetical protein